MPYAKYRFRTSGFIWSNGVIALTLWLFLVYFDRKSPSQPIEFICSALFLISILCFAGRFTLDLDLQQGHVKEVSGFWPFVRTRFEGVKDFTTLLITYASGGTGGGTYKLWLIHQNGRRISLCAWSSWPKISQRAQELSSATGWPVVDQTNGRNSLPALLDV